MHREAAIVELHCGLEVCVPPPYLDIQPAQHVYNQHHVCIVWVGAMIIRKGSSPGQVNAQPTFKKAQQGEWGGGY